MIIINIVEYLNNKTTFFFCVPTSKYYFVLTNYLVFTNFFCLLIRLRFLIKYKHTCLLTISVQPEDKKYTR